MKIICSNCSREMTRFELLGRASVHIFKWIIPLLTTRSIKSSNEQFLLFLTGVLNEAELPCPACEKTNIWITINDTPKEPSSENPNEN